MLLSPSSRQHSGSRHRSGYNDPRAWVHHRKTSLRDLRPHHIDRAAGPTIDLTKTEYSVTFGGSKDAVGTVLLGSPAGLEALTAFLHMIGLASPEIDIARRVLSEQSHYEIPDVKLSPTILRQLGDPGMPR